MLLELYEHGVDEKVAHDCVQFIPDPYAAAEGAHAIAVRSRVCRKPVVLTPA